MARAGWTQELAKRLHRPDPKARVIVQADVVTRAAVKQRKDHWEGYDTNPGVTVLDDGRMVITPTTDTILSNTTSDANITDLNRAGGPIVVAGVEWGGSEPTSFSLEEVSIHLDPDPNNTGPQVDTWVMQAFRVDVERGPLDGSDLIPISQPIEVEAGASAGDVVFPFPTGRELRPKRFGPPTVDGGVLFSGNQPVTFFMVWALDEDGNLVTSNVAWPMDTSSPSLTTANNTLAAYELTRVSSDPNADAPTRWSITTGGATPRMSVVKQSFTARTVTYTTNPLDLGAVPTEDVRFSFEDETPDDTTIAYEVNDGSGWVTVTSGQFAVADLGLSLVQAYSFRLTLDPGSPANKTPAAVSARAEEVSVVDFDGLAQVQVTGWQSDPTNLKGSICEATITALQDGKKDYRDKATLLVANNAVRDIAFRVHVGWKDSGALRGIHIDTLDLDDYTGEGAAMKFVCVGRNARLSNVKLPPFDTTDNSREPIDYENETLAAVYDDLLGTQLAMDARLRGTDVSDTTQVTKRITNSTAIEEIDAVAYLAGGSIITSQGRLKFVPMHQEDGGQIQAIFRSEDIVPTGVGPGLRARVPEVDVLWDYDFEEGRYTKEAVHKSADALLYFDPWRVDGEPESVPDVVTQWVDTQELAGTLGSRIVQTRGVGTILWSFGTTYAHPYLEPGDLVAIQTDRFAARDPQNNGRALRGRLWAIGRIVRVGNVAGSEFMIWIQRYSDIRGATTVVDRRGFIRPEIERIYTKSQTEKIVTKGFLVSDSTTEVLTYTRKAEQGTESPLNINELGEVVDENGDPIDPDIALVSDGEAARAYTLPGPNEMVHGFAEPRDKDFFAGTLVEFEIHPVDRNISVHAIPRQEGSTGILRLEIHDPRLVLTSLEFRTREGLGEYGDWLDTWDLITGVVGTDEVLVREESVGRIPKHTVSIEWRGEFTDEAGITRPIGGEHTFDADQIAEVSGATITFDGVGNAVATGLTDEDGVRMYVTVQEGSAPSDPTAAANDGLIDAKFGQVNTLVPIAQGAVAFLSVVAEDSNGNLGPVKTVQQRRGIGEKLPFGYGYDPSQPGGGGTGVLTSAFSDPTLAITAIKFDRRIGNTIGGSWFTSWDSQTGTIGADTSLSRVESVNLPAKHTAEIKVLVEYVDEDGNAHVEGSTEFPPLIFGHTFDPDTIAEITQITAWEGPSGDVTVELGGDEDTADMYATVTTDGSTPADPTSAANDVAIVGRSGADSSGKSAKLGDTIKIRAVGYDSDGNPGPILEKTISLGTVSKTLRFPHTAFTWDPADDLVMAREYIEITATTEAVAWHSAAIPKGVELTVLRLRCRNGEALKANVQAKLYRVDDSGGSVEIASVSGFLFGGWSTQTDSFTEEVGDNTYVLEVEFQITGSGLGDYTRRLAWVELDYDMPTLANAY